MESQERLSPDLDSLWRTVKEYINDTLEGTKPTGNKVMQAYSAEVALETRPGSRYVKQDGTRVHGVRVRIIRMIQEHYQRHGDEPLDCFRQKWKKSTNIIFSYHDRHYVRCCIEEGSNNLNLETAVLLTTDPQPFVIWASKFGSIFVNKIILDNKIMFGDALSVSLSFPSQSSYNPSVGKITFAIASTPKFRSSYCYSRLVIDKTISFSKTFYFASHDDGPTHRSSGDYATPWPSSPFIIAFSPDFPASFKSLSKIMSHPLVADIGFLLTLQNPADGWTQLPQWGREDTNNISVAISGRIRNASNDAASHSIRRSLLITTMKTQTDSKLPLK